MKNKPLSTLVVGVILLVIVGVGGYFLFRDRFQDNSPKQEDNTKIIDSVSISYPEGWEEVNRNDEEKASGIILKLKRKDLSDTFLLRTTVGTLDANFNIDGLPDLVVAGFKKEIYGFELVSKEVHKVGTYDSAQVKYKQKYADTQKVYENQIDIIPTSRQTFYLIFRGESSNDNQLEKDIKKISEDLADYLKSNL